MKFGYMEELMYEIWIYGTINVWNWDIWKNQCMKLEYIEGLMYEIGIYGRMNVWNWDI